MKGGITISRYLRWKKSRHVKSMHRLFRRSLATPAVGAVGKASKVVTQNITAAALGSGSLNVFGTPAMVALMEEAACAACAPSLGADETTVGTKVEIVHLKCTPLGMGVRAEATCTGTKGNFMTFDIVYTGF